MKPDELLRRLTRDPNAHKGTCGHTLVIAGSQGMSGAAVLCGLASLRTGSGLVTVATPGCIQPIVAGFDPCYMTIGLHNSVSGQVLPESVEQLVEPIRRASVVALGPGLGQSVDIQQFVRRVLDLSEVPVVLDADGLNALGRVGQDDIPHWVNEVSCPLIFTPHPGEFTRLTGVSTDSLAQDRLGIATRCASQLGCVLVLKGAGTVVTNGIQDYVNSTGNPGMATGGSGDVLTGVIAALVAQGLDPFEAAVLGSHVHGRAGDLAVESLSELSVTARDLIDSLPQATRLCPEE